MTKNILYHYCSLETFKNIIANKTIRVSDCSMTNDFSETKWISTLVGDVFIDTVKNNSEFCLKYNISDKVLDFFIKQINSTIDSVFYKNSRDMMTYVSCFSESDDTLSQWRGYANNAQGVAIGFDKTVLQTFDTGGYNYHFKKVIYDKKEQIQYIQSCIGDIVSAYSKVDLNCDEEEILSVFSSFLTDLVLRIAAVRNDSPLFKNDSFKEEREWRLYVNNHLINFLYEHDNDDEIAGDIEENYIKECLYSNGFRRYPVQYKTTDQNIVSYFDLDFDRIKDKFVKRIVIGPKCEVSKFNLQVFLSSCGYDYTKIKIDKSKATYR